MRKEIVELNLEEQNLISGGCACKCNHVRDESHCHGSVCHGSGHHGGGCHGGHCRCGGLGVFDAQTGVCEYTVGEAGSLSECSAICLSKGDTVSSCL